MILSDIKCARVCVCVHVFIYMYICVRVVSTIKLEKYISPVTLKNDYYVSHRCFSYTLSSHRYRIFIALTCLTSRKS